MSLFALAHAVQVSNIGTAIRESLWLFSILIITHVLALMVAGGTVFYFDLRLLGVGLKRAPVSEVAAQLLPWTWGGFAVMFVTGGLLVWSEAERLYGNVFFRMKVVFLLLAGLNVLLFHTIVFRRVATWDRAPVAPLQARLAGGVSLALWFGMIAAGRAIGYSIN